MFKNVIKILFGNIALLFLFKNFIYSDQSGSELKEKAPYRILIPIPCIGGEGEWGIKLEKAAKRLGWEARAFFFNPDWPISRPFDFERVCDPFEHLEDQPFYLKDVINEFKPDFIISLYPKIYAPLSLKIPHYLAITRSHEKVIGTYSRVIRKFQGFLSVPQNHEIFHKFFKDLPGNYPLIDWVPSVLRTRYKPLKYSRLFYAGTNWDALRSSKPYLKCFRYLASFDLVDIYGPKFAWEKVGLVEFHKADLPYDGECFTNALTDCGIVLVLHSQEHLEHGLISARIFEAAAAGAVIISDRHSFVEKEFQDSVLYIDIDKDNKLSGEEMFRQIYNHLMWISENPEKAEKMARKAHAIFDQKFTLEAQLQMLGDFHEKHKPNHTFAFDPRRGIRAD